MAISWDRLQLLLHILFYQGTFSSLGPDSREIILQSSVPGETVCSSTVYGRQRVEQRSIGTCHTLLLTTMETVKASKQYAHSYLEWALI